MVDRQFEINEPRVIVHTFHQSLIHLSYFALVRSFRLDKSMQINGINGKRRITDWKSVGMTNNTTGMQKPNENGNELVLPNCPGATISPKKANNFNSKKKLSTFNNIYQDSSSFLITPVIISNLNQSLYFYYFSKFFLLSHLHGAA